MRTAAAATVSVDAPWRGRFDRGPLGAEPSPSSAEREGDQLPADVAIALRLTSSAGRSAGFPSSATGLLSLPASRSGSGSATCCGRSNGRLAAARGMELSKARFQPPRRCRISKSSCARRCSTRRAARGSSASVGSIAAPSTSLSPASVNQNQRAEMGFDTVLRHQRILQHPSTKG